MQVLYTESRVCSIPAKYDILYQRAMSSFGYPLWRIAVYLVFGTATVQEAWLTNQK